MQRCFDSTDGGRGCNTCSLHLRGRWTASAAGAPYRLTSRQLFDQAGIKISNVSKHYYGRCADREEAGVRRRRALLEWTPSDCSLLPFDSSEACATFRAVGPSILLVGDSTTGQLFTSLVALLGGTYGRNALHKSVMSDITASMCDDTVRMAFVRSDLLIWSRHAHEFNLLRKCGANQHLIGVAGGTTGVFTRRATEHADVVILGTGHHVTPSIHKVSGSDAANAFFASNLNHTLSQIIGLRRANGVRRPASSVVFVGASLPVPHCSRYSEPISLGEYLRADAELATVTPAQYALSWREVTRLNWVARTVRADPLRCRHEPASGLMPRTRAHLRHV